MKYQVLYQLNTRDMTKSICYYHAKCDLRFGTIYNQSKQLKSIENLTWKVVWMSIMLYL